MAVREAIASLELQASEAVVVHAASRILAAWIAAGKLTDQNRVELITLSVRTAIELAVETDRSLESDEEHGTRGRLTNLG